MAYVYADLIRRGVMNRKTGEPYKLDDVPARLRDAVAALLED